MGLVFFWLANWIVSPGRNPTWLATAPPIAISPAAVGHWPSRATSAHAPSRYARVTLVMVSVGARNRKPELRASTTVRKPGSAIAWATLRRNPSTWPDGLSGAGLSNGSVAPTTITRSPGTAASTLEADSD